MGQARIDRDADTARRLTDAIRGIIQIAPREGRPNLGICFDLFVDGERYGVAIAAMRVSQETTHAEFLERALRRIVAAVGAHDHEVVFTEADMKSACVALVLAMMSRKGDPT